MRNAFLSLLLIVSVTAPAYADIRGLPSITVLADPSMTNALTDLIRVYSRDHNISVTAEYGATEELVEDIEEGSSADVFISANTDAITKLKQQGVIDVYSFSNLVEDRLVFIASKTHILTKLYKEKIEFPELLTLIANKSIPVAIIIIGDLDSSGLGYYTQAVLSKLGFLNRIKPITLPAANEREAVYLIANGENPGITYASDAHANYDAVTVISEIPTDLHPLILYQAGVIAGENMAPARDFVNFLKTSEAMEIFAHHGFITKRQ
jgi:molybdate transport system substrate-binding protein